jgi:hypothetical protein
MTMRIIALTILCNLVAVATAQDMGTQAIYNYKKVDEHHATGGQPTEDQLKAAAAEGFATIIVVCNEAPWLVAHPGRGIPRVDLARQRLPGVGRFHPTDPVHDR